MSSCSTLLLSLIPLDATSEQPRALHSALLRWTWLRGPLTMHWSDVKGDATERCTWGHCKDSVGNVAGMGDNTEEREQDQRSGSCGRPGLGH